MSWFSKSPKTKKPVKKLRRGLLTMQWTGQGLLNKGTSGSYQLEVEEIEHTPTRSKIRILSVYGADNWEANQVREEHNGEWVNTNLIEWLAPKAQLAKDKEQE